MHRLAGGLLATAATCVALAPTSLAAGHAPRAVAARTTVTGEITKVGPSAISIGRIGCKIPVRLEPSVGRFVVTDPVRITCLNGRLQNVRYSPELATAQTTRLGGGNAPTTVPTPPPATSSPSGVRSVVYTIGVLYLGGPPPGATTTVTGTIDDISSTTVTVAGMTCSYKAIPASGYFTGPELGDSVTLTCTGGYLIRLSSTNNLAH